MSTPFTLSTCRCGNVAHLKVYSSSQWENNETILTDDAVQCCAMQMVNNKIEYETNLPSEGAFHLYSDKQGI